MHLFFPPHTNRMETRFAIFQRNQALDPLKQLHILKLSKILFEVFTDSCKARNVPNNQQSWWGGKSHTHPLQCHYPYRTLIKLPSSTPPEKKLQILQNLIREKVFSFSQVNHWHQLEDKGMSSKYGYVICSEGKRIYI